MHRLHQLERPFVDLRVCSVNVWTVRGKSREIVDLLERRSLDNCCVQETRFSRKSVSMISGKAAEYKPFWIGNEEDLGVGMFLAKIWVDKIIDISKVSDRMIVIKLLVQGIIISVTSFYAPE